MIRSFKPGTSSNTLLHTYKPSTAQRWREMLVLMLQNFSTQHPARQIAEYSVILILSSCSFNLRTPTSSAMPDAFRSRLWVVIVRTFGARSDGGVGSSARINNLLHSRKASQAAECFGGAADSFLRRLQCTNWDKQLKGLYLRLARGQLSHCDGGKAS